MSGDERARLLRDFAACFGGTLTCDEGAAPVIVFERALSEAQLRGWQRALRGRYRRAWLAEGAEPGEPGAEPGSEFDSLIVGAELRGKTSSKPGAGV